MSITQQQALEALDELEGSARGDEPFNHFAAPLLRQYIEQGASPRYGTIAERAEQGLRNGLWATQQGAAPEADVVQPLSDDELQDLAHSAYEEALSFGLSVDTFLRYFKGIRKRAAVQHPQQEQSK